MIYAITESGDLLWYRHDGRDDGSFRWAAPEGKKVGTGWNFPQVFSGGGGVIYAVTSNYELLWYRHDGHDDGSFRWAAPEGKKVGSGWDFKHLFSPGGGVIMPSRRAAICSGIATTGAATAPSSGPHPWEARLAAAGPSRTSSAVAHPKKRLAPKSGARLPIRCDICMQLPLLQWHSGCRPCDSAVDDFQEEMPAPPGRGPQLASSGTFSGAARSWR